MRSFEPAFRRIHAEHRVLRALLTAAEGDIDRVLAIAGDEERATLDAVLDAIEDRRGAGGAS